MAEEYTAHTALRYLVQKVGRWSNARAALAELDKRYERDRKNPTYLDAKTQMGRLIKTCENNIEAVLDLARETLLTEDAKNGNIGNRPADG